MDWLSRKRWISLGIEFKNWSWISVKRFRVCTRKSISKNLTKLIFYKWPQIKISKERIRRFKKRLITKESWLFICLKMSQRLSRFKRRKFKRSIKRIRWIKKMIKIMIKSKSLIRTSRIQIKTRITIINKIMINSNTH